MSTPRVFISYSHSDKEWARKFAETIVTKGLEVWFDEFNVKPGEPLAEAIENGLRASDAVVLLISRENINRPNVFFEIGAALGMKKTIIPVVPSNVENHKLPLPVQRIRYLVRNSPEETAKEVVTAIESLYGEAA